MKLTAFFLCSLLSALLLAGCDTKDAAVSEPPNTVTTTAATAASEAAQPMPSIPETTVASDVAAQVEEAEAQYVALQSKLLNDGSLTQADMNELAGQQYTLWDTLLNELWAQLTRTLPQAQMQQLLQEERAWIRWKESSIALAADYYSGGSLSVLAADMRAAKLTRDRVYELAQILTTQQYPSAHSDTDLYYQVFLPLVSNGQQPDYDNLLLLLDFRGLTLQEDEGIFQITDPQLPGNYLYGSLSNESGALTIPQLGYCFEDGTSQLGVRVDFFTIPPDYYIGATTWDDGTLVSSLEELTTYLHASD